jgi:signal transduction histidine kinase/CheY-like chemotaxis protein/HPt (histidine-containing phosphotransfer) domain-containing protein
MGILRNFSIRTKATVTIVFVSTAVLALALSVVLTRDYFTFREDEVDKLTTLARVISANSTAAVAFEDREAARDGLGKLATDPNIKAAFIWSNNDQFASYLRPGESGAQAMMDELRAAGTADRTIRDDRRDMFVQVPISLDGETIATLYLVADLSRIQARMQEYFWLALGVLGSAIVVALLVSLLLGFVISKPLSYLSKTMRTIEKEKDYRQRMKKHGNDEMGQLIDSFNAMLEQIQLRDEKLSENRNDLEQQVKARTQELVQTNASLWQAVNDLEEAKSKAEAANKAKSEFLATVSHEIRTPLNGVLGTTEILLSSGLTEKQLRFAQIVHGSAKTLLAIINTILDFSKIEAGKVELETVDFNPREIVEEVQDLFLEVADKKGLKYESVIAPNVPQQVRGDSGRLRQVLTNLVGNAMKFTEKGKVSVRLQVQETSGATVLLRFEVKDTGIGIDPSARERIFESFAQADQSTTRRYGGTGLGLTIAKQLSQIMGGGVGLDSKVGEGSTFWFTVRLGLAGVSAAQDEKRRMLSGVRIIVVDGDAAARDALMSQLAALGIIATATGNLDEGLTLMRSAAQSAKPFDVAFIDATSGRPAARLVRTIRSTANTQAVRVVLMGNVLGEQEIKEQGFPSNCRILLRPLRQSALFDCLSDIIRDKVETSRDPRGGIAMPDRAAQAAPGIAEPRRPSCKILLAEDNPVNREVACEALLQLGLEVETANDGREAIEKWKATKFDLILMDCHMPNLDGIDAAREIRNVERSNGVIKGIPIVALTANVRGEDYDRCMAVGMNDYLTKPLTLKELGVSLSRWLGANAIQAIPERSPVREPEVTPASSSPPAAKTETAPAKVPPAPPEAKAPETAPAPAVAEAPAAPAAAAPTPTLDIPKFKMPSFELPPLPSAPKAPEAAPVAAAPVAAAPEPATPSPAATPAQPPTINFIMVEEPETTGRALVVVPQQTRAVITVPSAPAADEPTEKAADAATAEPQMIDITPAAPVEPVGEPAPILDSASAAANGHAEPASATPAPAEDAAPTNGSTEMSTHDPATAEAMKSLDMETIAYLRSLRRGDGPSVLERAIGVYLDTAPTALEELRRCVAAGDASAVWRIAHSLKSSSASLGAKNLAQQMGDMESRARENDLNEAPAHLERVESEFKKVSTALTTTLREEKESCRKSA